MNREWKNVSNEMIYNTGVINLFNGVFEKNIDEKYLNWKNRENPSGESVIQLAVKEGVIGHVCLLKYKIKLFNQAIFAGQAVDTMVNPNYRRMGIFEELSKRSLERGKMEGLELVFRFPNHMALSASVSKLNTRKICDIPQYLKILNPYKATSLFTTNKIVRLAGALGFGAFKIVKSFGITKYNEYSIRNVEFFGAEYDNFWDGIKEDYKIAIERKAVYLNWRYVESPGKYFIRAVYYENQLTGFVIASIEEKKAKDGSVVRLCHIVDILCKSNHKNALGLLLNQTEMFAKERGACAISCWMLKHWFYQDKLKGVGYFQFRAPSVLAGLIISDSLKNNEEKILNEKNWYITIGDSDYV